MATDEDLTGEQSDVVKSLPARGDADFHSVIAAEIEDINTRRRKLGRTEQEPDIGDDAFKGRKMLDVVGLALSGGGIRSAAFCLGALQALNARDVIEKVDYLSTVSGGGYTGASLSATMTKTGGTFVYGGGKTVEEIGDTASVGQIRNYSNYLFPFGPGDVLTAFAIVVRGLMANFAQVLAVLLLLASVTAFVDPDIGSLVSPDFPGWSADWLPTRQFGFTAALALVLPVFFLGWALYRSRSDENSSEFRGRMPKVAVKLLLVLAFIAFLELQPFVIAGMFAAADSSAAIEASRGQALKPVFLKLVASWIEDIALVTAPIVAFVAAFRKWLGDVVGAAAVESRLQARFAGLFASALIWIAGAALPIIIWVGYLYLSYWAIPECVDAASGCATSAAFAHTPSWILWLAGGIDYIIPGGPFMPFPAPKVLYLVAAVLLLVVLWFLKPNANSLHRLYRDRLSKAFLFDPTMRAEAGGVAGDRDLTPLDTMKLSEMDSESTPYQLINAALNIQGSDFSNRRGRNADFFLFSRRYVGGPATGYAQTEQMEKKARDLDLATAMAISGAAASANMGSKTIQALTPTLALLNVRLGYWLTNPYFAFQGEKVVDGKPVFERDPPNRVWSYLWAELASRLNEDSESVYITDGGHIENLGIYELLRRRCKLIVAVDAEADPEMRFNSLVSLERYARIDLGVRINVPLRDVAETSRAWMGQGSDAAKSDVAGSPSDKKEPTRGPHVTIGTIDYGRGEIGHLVYVKSSLTGDESNYIRDYARLHPRFPHESTGDQFFSEEQFEVYRALGFHAMYGFVSGTDDVAVAPGILDDASPKPPAVAEQGKDAAPDDPREHERSVANPGYVVGGDDPALKPIRDML